MTNLHETDRLVELLPCPFCGSHDVFVQNAGWQANTFMRCRGCNTTFSLDDGSPRAHDSTVAAWNRRALTAMGGKAEPVAWITDAGLGLLRQGLQALALPTNQSGTGIPLYASPVQARTGEVTDAMVEAMSDAAVVAIRPYARATLTVDEHRDLVRTAMLAALSSNESNKQ